MSACEHSEFDANVFVTKISATGGMIGEVKVWCRLCGHSIVPPPDDLLHFLRDLAIAEGEEGSEVWDGRRIFTREA